MNVASSSALLIAAAALTACATVRCEHFDIVVDAREERTQLITEPRGIRTDELGRVHRRTRETLVPSYWIRSQDGHWHEVSEHVYRSAEPGRTLAVCR